MHQLGSNNQLILKDKLLLSLSEYLEWECEYGDKYTYIMATAEIEMYMKIIMPHAVVIAMYFLRDGLGREGGSKGFKSTDST